MRKLEVIAFNILCCKEIEKAGAYRIELCANPKEGGTTPSPGLIISARKALSLELYPIIRPRGGDFYYSEAEFEVIQADVLFCKNIGCDGVVTGMLLKDGRIDTKRIAEIVKMASPMQVTFHRAFDRTADPYEALEDVIRAGCARILTSGLQPTAMGGRDMIKKLVRQAGNRIVIMPGSGIRSLNIREIAELTGATEFHSSAGTTSGSKMEYQNENLSDAQTYTCVDRDEVLSMMDVLQQLDNAHA